MYTAAFRYLRPATIPEAEEMYLASADGRFIAGGQSLIPAMKQRLASPADLIDLSRIPGLAFIRCDGDDLKIGAGTTHADVAASADVKRSIPALSLLAGMIGDPAVRHRGTLGGSIANNDPAADYPAAVLALGASIATNRRQLACEGFFTGLFETLLEPGEIVTQVAFRLPRRAAYAKHPNPASRYAMPGVFVADFGDEIRVAVTGAKSCVYRARELESALKLRLSPQVVDSVEIDAADFSSDLFASAQYRAHLVKVMTHRAVASML